MSEEGEIGTTNGDSGASAESAITEPSQGEIVVPKCYPKWRGKPVYGGNKEALGWTLCSVAVLINYIGIGAFFATTIDIVATRAVECHTENAGKGIDLNAVCGPAITFIKPSSLLTFYAMVISSIVACALPFIGAVVDHTNHRLLLGRISSLVFNALLFPLIFLNRFNYLIILACHGCSVFIGWFVQTFQYAYLPELTTDELKLAEWTKCITIWSYSGMFIYLCGVIGGVRVLDKGHLPFFTNQLSTAVLFCIDVVFLQISWWFLFGKRKPLHKLPEGSSLCTVGFKHVFTTAKHIWKNYRALKWYYMHISLANSGWQAFGIIILAYLTHFLGFTPLQVGIAIGCSLFASIPGAMLGTFVAKKLDPLQSSRINMVLMIICVTFFAIVLNAPGQEIRTYIYLGFFGFCGGWKSTLDKLISSSIIPDNQSTEMMGFFLFVDQWLLWMPLLVYTVMNEQGIRALYNVLILNVYLCISLFFLCMAGSYKCARDEVNRASVYLGKSDLADVEKAAEKDDAGDKQSQPTTQDDVIIAEA